MVLAGPPHLGKSTFTKQLLEQEVDPSDLIFMSDGVDGVREAVDFYRSTPLKDSFRVVFIDNADLLGEPAQDAILKMMEEPHQFMKLILSASDIGNLQPALKSRIRNIIYWSPLSNDEMIEFSNSFSSVVCGPLMKLSTGHPGLYHVMMETPGFEDFFLYMKRIVNEDGSMFLSDVPDIIKSLKGSSLVRDAVIHIMKQSIVNSPDRKKIIEVLRFCQTLSHTPSANSEIHWMRMLSRF